MNRKLVLLLIFVIVGFSISSVAAADHSSDKLGDTEQLTFTQWMDKYGYDIYKCPSVSVFHDWQMSYIRYCDWNGFNPILDLDVDMNEIFSK